MYTSTGKEKRIKHTHRLSYPTALNSREGKDPWGFVDNREETDALRQLQAAIAGQRKSIVHVRPTVVQRILDAKEMAQAIGKGEPKEIEPLLEKVEPSEVAQLIGLGIDLMTELFRKLFGKGVNTTSEKSQKIGVEILFGLLKSGQLHSFSYAVSPADNNLLESGYALSHQKLVEPIAQSLLECAQVGKTFSTQMTKLQTDFLSKAKKAIDQSQSRSQIDRSEERLNAISFDVSFHKKRLSSQFEKANEMKTQVLANQFIGLFEEQLAKLDQKLDFQLHNDLTLLSDPFVMHENSRREWNEEELQSILPVVARLPEDHVHGNPELKGFRRQDTHPPSPQWGAFYSSDTKEMTLTDAAFKDSRYRATGMTSVLADHTQGSKVTGKGPVSPIDEALTHEIGHSVHDKYKAEFQYFNKVAGWTEFSSSDGAAGAVYPGPNQKGKRAKLDSQLKKLKPDSNIVVDGQVIRRIGDTRFSIRILGSLPTDTDKTSKADGTLFDYAQEKSKEHFAELYTHMVNIPEEMYRSYITQPAQEYERHQKIADNATFFTKTSDQRTADFYKQKMDRLRKIWDIMKHMIFKVDPTPVNQLAELMQKANISPLAINQFIKEADQTATPYQQDRLVRKYQNRFSERFNAYHLAECQKILQAMPKLKDITQDLRKKIAEVEGTEVEKQELLRQLDELDAEDI